MIIENRTSSFDFTLYRFYIKFLLTLYVDPDALGVSVETLNSEKHLLVIIDIAGSLCAICFKAMAQRDNFMNVDFVKIRL